jgi:DNA-binding CsgD family transcriptional regulator
VEEIHRVIHEIYGAAVDPDRWPDALVRIEKMFKSTASGLYMIDTAGSSMSEISLRGTHQALDKHHQASGFHRNSEHVNNRLSRQDLHHALDISLPISNNISTKFYMIRPRREGSFDKDEIEQFRHLAGHLKNAVKIGYRLARKESLLGGTEHLVDQMRLGIIYLDEHCRILKANRIAEGILERSDGLYTNNNAVIAKNTEDNKMLAMSIRQAVALHLHQSGDTPRLFSIQRSPGHRAFRVTTMPFPRSQNIFPIQRPAVALLINDPELDPSLAIKEFKHRYKLTTSEAGLAQKIASGFTLREAASRLGITYESARTYLKVIFQKTHTRKQSELVRLILSEGFLETRYSSLITSELPGI